MRIAGLRIAIDAKDFLPSVTLVVLPATMDLLQAAVEEQVKTTVKSARVQQLQSGSKGPLTVADLVSNDYLRNGDSLKSGRTISENSRPLERKPGE